MKILTKEEEDAHYASVLKYGAVGGALGLAGGWVGLLAASRRWTSVRHFTLPLKAFLVSSAGTAAAVIAGDQGSRAFDLHHREGKVFYSTRQARLRSEELADMTARERLAAWARREKYKIIGFTWAASMVGSWLLIRRNPYLTGQQKIVQARVYAQGLTLGVLCASAALEIHDQRQGRGILDAVKQRRTEGGDQRLEPAKERYEGEGLWKDMVTAEEERLNGRKK